jgi:hypothetical protein
MARKDSLLAHCLARAVVDDAGGDEAARAKYGEHGEKARAMSMFQQIKLGTRVTPKASRTAGFIILWAWAMKSEGKDAYTITEYQRFYNEGERQAYRSQSEFRDLWPEFETPNELARQIVKHLDKRPNPLSMPTSIPVTA